jgi:hypothetical protein
MCIFSSISKRKQGIVTLHIITIVIGFAGVFIVVLLMLLQRSASDFCWHISTMIDINVITKTTGVVDDHDFILTFSSEINFK